MSQVNRIDQDRILNRTQVGRVWDHSRTGLTCTPWVKADAKGCMYVPTTMALTIISFSGSNLTKVGL